MRQKDGSAWVRDQFEAVAVSFTGTGGEENSVRVQRRVEFCRIVTADLFAQFQCTARFGFIIAAPQAGDCKRIWKWKVYFCRV